MNILFVATDFPFPENKSGGTVNIVNMLKFLKNRCVDFSVDLLFIGYDEKIDSKDMSAAKIYFRTITVVRQRTDTIGRLIKLMFRKRIKYQYDTVFYCDYLSSFFASKIDCKLGLHYLYMADSRVFYLSQFPTILNKLKSLQRRIELMMIEKYFSQIIYVNQRDANYDARNSKYPHKYISIPISSLDIEMEVTKEYEFDLVFSGNLDYPPNLLASQFIVNELLPRLLKDHPKIKICIAGRFNSSKILNLQNISKGNILFTGEVEDINYFHFKSKIYIAPLYFGSGMKNKILHAMIAKMPVITTPEGASGFAEEIPLVICNTPQDWVREISDLLNNPLRANSLGMQNYLAFKEYYETSRVMNKFLDLFYQEGI